MKRNINNVFVIAQKEFADNLWSPRFWVLISIFLLILFSYSYRTGLGSSFTDVIQIIAVFSPIIGIALGFDAVTKETESNSLNVLLTHPVFRDNVITGKILGSMSTLLLVVFLSVSVLFGTNLLISGKQASLLELNRFLIFAIFTFIYLLIFLAIGILTSVISKNEVDSLTYGISAWLNLCVVFGATIMIIASIVTGQSLFDMGNNQQFRELNFQLQKFSPIYHYSEVTSGFSDLSWGGGGETGNY
ncbi:ABC transporter permease [Candidatus Methanoperedens nitratireducens]|uniref:ABC-type transport system involved in multi-copper enzyme maturation, permease component n=1 Tax=Candidatus Methanoperedens nitratireducens TaxID=1392998 RepID=A0A284VI76_9EURY|nr:ABC transporter permease [Candidatus Methanoperedens nitroreducens]SNQ58968.1 ABC-type transport system involved in multi-copper enzyme maturation, permease component [Candidatus Methanoperedens nitroreducens]